MNEKIIDQDGRTIYPDEIRTSREVTRGDSFDFDGSKLPIPSSRSDKNPLLGMLLQNPAGLLGELTPRQAENIKALLIGGGTAGVYKLLSKHIGDKAAGAVGGFLSAWLASSVIKESK